MMIEAGGKNSTVVNKNIQKNHLGETDFFLPPKEGGVVVYIKETENPLKP